ncbi:MAG: hypothetical protein L0J71_01890, partial [Bifidobacterium crudilactis]|nr:hypothetical protein [Bifidobacterium crudilactis]
MVFASASFAASSSAFFFASADFDAAADDDAAAADCDAASSLAVSCVARFELQPDKPSAKTAHSSIVLAFFMFSPLFSRRQCRLNDIARMLIEIT